MPRNTYISHGSVSERNLYEDLIIEAVKIFGHDIYYIPRKVARLDKILNEDYISTFEDAYMVEMYVESIDGFEGDGKLITKFGLEIRDQLTLAVSVRRWNQLVGRFGYPAESVKPREGDLIYVPLTKGLFEIKYVDDKKPFFQLSGLPVYKLTVELFEYVNQKIDTGIKEVDEIQSYSSQGFSVIAEFAASEKYSSGDDILMTFPDATTGSCEILKIDLTDTANAYHLLLGPITYNGGSYQTLPVDTVLTNVITGVTSTIVEVHDIENSNDDIAYPNDDNAQNSAFETEGNAVIDWSISDPFGEAQLP